MKGMRSQMVATQQKVTKARKRRRQHARMWQQGTQFSRLLHITSRCAICDRIYRFTADGEEYTAW